MTQTSANNAQASSAEKTFFIRKLETSRLESPTNASTTCHSSGSGSASVKAVSTSKTCEKEKIESNFDYGGWLPSEAEAELSSDASDDDENIVVDILDALSDEDLTQISLSKPVEVAKLTPVKGVQI